MSGSGEEGEEPAGPKEEANFGLSGKLAAVRSVPGVSPEAVSASRRFSLSRGAKFNAIARNIEAVTCWVCESLKSGLALRRRPTRTRASSSSSMSRPRRATACQPAAADAASCSY